MRSTGLEPVLLSEHAPQTCAYADSATTACRNSKNYYSNLPKKCQGAEIAFWKLFCSGVLYFAFLMEFRVDLRHKYWYHWQGMHMILYEED